MCWGRGRGAKPVWGHFLFSCREGGPANTGTHMSQASGGAFTKHPDISRSSSHGSGSGTLERSYAKTCCKRAYFGCSYLYRAIVKWLKQNEGQSCRWSLGEHSTAFAFLSLPPVHLPPYTSRWWLDSWLQAVQGILVSACSTARIQQKCSWPVSNMEEILHPSGSKQEKKQIKRSYNISCEGSRANIVAGSWPAAFI